MRRSLVALVTCLALALAGCTGAADEIPEQEPEPTVATAPPDGTPSADGELQDLAEGLAAGDITAAPVVNEAVAQEDLETILARMRGIRPTTVQVEDVEYAPDGRTATGLLAWSWEVDISTWDYRSEVPLERDTDGWRIDWAPSIVHPELTDQTRLGLTREPPRREAINDNAGLALVEQLTMYQVGLDKAAIPPEEWPAAAERIATLMGTDPATFSERVAAGGERQFVVASTVGRESIPPEIAEAPGAHVAETERMVPFSTTFAVGILGTSSEATAEIIENSDGRIWQGDLVGRSGLQLRYDEQLRGVPLMRVDVVARAAAEGETPAAVEPTPVFTQDASVGTPVDTSIDRELQLRAEEILAEQEGLASLVVVRPQDGALLVAANSPVAGEYPQATFGRFAPGSTFKVASALAMLRDGMTPTSTVECPASVEIGGTSIGNYSGYPGAFVGSITLTQALAHSCNTSFALAAEHVTPEKLQAAAGSLGIGIDYDAGFSAYFGTVEPLSHPLDRAASMYGQGQITMSPMAMAAVAASVAAGETVIPWVVEGTRATSTADPLAPEEAGQLQEMMRSVVDDGSATVLQGVMEGAKTGTAEFGQAGAQQTHAWMIAWNGDYAVAAFVEVGTSGSGDAAPLIVELFR